jgi:hypothetical protein
MQNCRSINCVNAAPEDSDFCIKCSSLYHLNKVQRTPNEALSEKYVGHFRSVEAFNEIDVYTVHHLFSIQDPSGCIQHASKKLLLSSLHTGGKATYSDIQEAKDTLVRWLQLNEPT